MVDFDPQLLDSDTDSMLCCMIVGEKVLRSKFHCSYWPSPAGQSRGTKPPSVERKIHTGTRKTKEITILNDVSFLFVSVLPLLSSMAVLYHVND